MKQILYFILYIALISSPAMSQNKSSGNEDILWIQKVVDNWHTVCRDELKIEVKALPWIIFYDSSSAWHLNADETMLHRFEKTQHSVGFKGTNYQLARLYHTKNIWVPDRDSIPVASALITTMPYAQNKKAFFIAPLPSLFHQFASPDQSSFLDFLFLGMNIHELTHTRQLPFVLPQLLEIDKSDKRESLDDNTVENEFAKNEQFKKVYLEENKHLWNAVFAVNEDSCIAEIEKAFQLIKIRRQEFLPGTTKH